MTSNPSDKNLSRDELALLLGASQTSDIISSTTLSNTPAGAPSSSRRHNDARQQQPDVSNMDRTQAAAFVAQQFKGKDNEVVKRHRVQGGKRAMQHHLLLDDAVKKMEGAQEDDDVEEEEEEEVPFRRKRKRTEAKVVSKREHRRSSSSSSSSEESSQSSRSGRRRRRRSSSSSSDDSADLRRRRARGKRNEARKESDEDDSCPKEEVEITQQPQQRIEKKVEPIHQRQAKPKIPDKNKSDSSSSDDSSTSSSSSSASTSSSEEIPNQPVSKPLFVPKSKRMTIAELEAQQQKLDEAEERKQKFNEKRTLQSRALVAEAVAESQRQVPATIGEDDDEELAGIINDDDSPEEQEREAWEIRELLRILQDVDRTAEEEREKLERERRRTMADDDERLQRKEGYRRPGEARRKDDKSKYLQRYHHRGAFYMDEGTLEEAGEGDVRHRAAEYSRAATGEDKVDKSMLPEVMQVKKFGFAGYSTKYKGLAKEDTTEKALDFLPIRSGKKGGAGGDRSKGRRR